jgi:ABC-type polysaccharide/polyol phosphate export permease
MMLLLGMLSTRFRDIPQVIGNIVQAAFFLSPILWRADMLGKNKYLADFNPLYHLIEVVRAPLLGDPIIKTSWLVVVGLLLILGILTYLFYNRARARVPFWL